jgi:arylsulfatase
MNYLSVIFSFIIVQAVEAKLPNIVFILADDLGYGELGCYGQEKIITPVIDQLAAEGMKFTQHYTGAPVCAPARCVLMTGKHLAHAEIRGNRDSGNGKTFPGQWPITADALTIAEVLKKAGYTTGAFGKWGLGPSGSSGDPNKQGFDNYYGFNCQRNAHSFYPPFLDCDGKELSVNKNPIPFSCICRLWNLMSQCILPKCGSTNIPRNGTKSPIVETVGIFPTRVLALVMQQ